MINKIRSIVKTDSPGWMYNYHVKLVVEYAKTIAKQECEDVDLVEITALLHDIGRARYGGKDHNISGAEDAKEILQGFGLNSEKITIVCDAIRSHSGKEHPVKNKIGTILKNADGLSHLDIVPILIDNNFRKKDGNIKEAVSKTVDKLRSEWDEKITLDNGKKLGKEKFDAAMTILQATLDAEDN